jgi:integrase
MRRQRARPRHASADGDPAGSQLLAPDDRKTLRALRRAQKGDHLFLTERGDHFSRDGSAKLLARAGERAGIDRRLCHPHALRHAAGHALANGGKVNAYQLQAVMGTRMRGLQRFTCRVWPA